jgi:hypothetical protein
MKEQWLGTKESWDNIMAMGIRWNEWLPGEMGTKTFFIETPLGRKRVNEGDWVVKSDDGKFYVMQKQN